MSIPTPAAAGTIGGGAQRWHATRLADLFPVIGFDPEEEGSGWALIATDLHATYDNGAAVADAFDARTLAQVAAISPAPDACLILGDVLTNLVSSFGAPADTSDGLLEVAAANDGLDVFAELATTYVILGNHDTPPLEDPTGDFMATNCDHFEDLHHSLTIGGVRIVLLSTSHDAALATGGAAYLAAELATLTAGQECIIATHQPAGARAYDFAHMPAIVDAVPEAMTNPLWHICGHGHRCQEMATYNAGATTIASFQIGTAGGTWMSFSDDTNPALGAIACRDGEIVGRFAWDGKDRQWRLWPARSRSGAVDISRQLEGVEGETVLASYIEGSYDRTGRLNTASGSTYRVAGTWLAYCYDVRANFPLPDGATKAFAVITVKPTTLEVSDDGSAWTAISPIPDLVDNALIFDIPGALQSADNLHIRIASGTGPHVSAWGFLS